MISRTFIGFGVGAFAGYFLGALVSCELLMPMSNLCGLGGVIVGFPAGGIAGALLARRIGKS